MSDEATTPRGAAHAPGAVVAALVCGVEHSGTTLVSDLVRQVPSFGSGFEGGVFLHDTPRAFAATADEASNPYFSLMIRGGWGLDEARLRVACDTDDFAEFYARVAEASDLFGPATRLFDKTPRYVRDLPLVSERAGHPPVITVHKDPRATVWSDLKRAGTADPLGWYYGYRTAKLSYMRACYAGYEAARDGMDNVLSVSLENLCFDALGTARRVYEHLGVPFELDYLLLKDVRFGQTRADYVSAPIVLEHREGLPASLRGRVEEDFAPFADWFFEA